MALPLKYHWRHLWERRTSTLLTLLVVAAVVSTLVWMLGFAQALRRSLSMANDERKLIVLRRGATSETNSAIPVSDYNKLTQVAGLLRDPSSDRPLLSPEMVVQVSLPRLRDGGRTSANVAVRGVDEVAFAVHSRVRIIEGRRFEAGQRELIVGRSAAAQFAGLRPGQTVDLGYGADRGYTVVGLFSSDGGPEESEIWGYLPSLMDAYQRTAYSSVSLRVREDADPREVIAQISGPAIELSAQTEGQYWSDQSAFIRAYLRVAYVLVGVMSLAALLSIANTMFSAVAGRTREIAMLRTIGFSRGQILRGFVLEALLLALLGGVLGCLACLAWLRTVGNTKDMFGATTFTVQAFEIHLSPGIAATALLFVALVGAGGAYLPARRAARLQVVSALREP
jgi:putative ABC transport system permease protein